MSPESTLSTYQPAVVAPKPGKFQRPTAQRADGDASQIGGARVPDGARGRHREFYSPSTLFLSVHWDSARPHASFRLHGASFGRPDGLFHLWDRIACHCHLGVDAGAAAEAEQTAPPGARRLTVHGNTGARRPRHAASATRRERRQVRRGHNNQEPSGKNEGGPSNDWRAVASSLSDIWRSRDRFARPSICNRPPLLAPKRWMCVEQVIYFRSIRERPEQAATCLKKATQFKNSPASSRNLLKILALAWIPRWWLCSNLWRRQPREVPELRIGGTCSRSSN